MEVARSTSKGKEMHTIVEVGPYKGLFGTMHSIVYEEGERGAPAEPVKGTAGAPAMKAGRLGQDRKKRKGQGFEGLWRGWRVGIWGLVGVWGAATLGWKRGRVLIDRLIDVCILVVTRWHGALALCWLYGIPGCRSRLCLE